MFTTLTTVHNYKVVDHTTCSTLMLYIYATCNTLSKVIYNYFMVSVFGWPDPNTLECCES
jgi:hypothetical protein